MKRTLFILSHQPNPRFIKQINMFSSDGIVDVIFFERSSLPNLLDNISPNVNMFNISRIPSSGSHFYRLIEYIKSIRAIRFIIKHNIYDAVFVNNLDTLLLSKFVSIRYQIPNAILEVSDLQQYVFSKNFIAKVAVFIESIIIRSYVDKLIVTSFKYYEIYYSNFFKKPWFLLENKPLSYTLPKKIDSKNGKLMIIGVVGLIYQCNPLKSLFEVVKSIDNVEVHIYGKLYEYQNSKKLVEYYTKKYKNIIYKGPYDFFNDVGKIYGSLDLLYVSYDMSENMINNRYALPNKLYESMYYRVPLIVSQGTYLSEYVKRLKIGYDVECENQEEIKSIIEYHLQYPSNFDISFNLINPNEYFADNDYVKLKRFVFN